MNIVIDTNVVVSAMKSRRGASFKLISLLPDERFSPVVSVPLVVEYQGALMREATSTVVTPEDIIDFVDFLCQVAIRQDIFFLWRPSLPDPTDELVLEAAVAGGCSVIVTYNKDDFRGAEQFGVRVLDAREFLTEIGAIR